MKSICLTAINIPEFVNPKYLFFTVNLYTAPAAPAPNNSPFFQEKSPFVSIIKPGVDGVES